MPLDRESQAFIELVRSRMPIIGSVSAPKFREVQAALAAATPKGPELARVEDIAIDTPAGKLPLRLYVPEGKPAAIVVFLHGGGWTIGSIANSDHTLRKMASTTGCAVVSVEYRLAPEHPFPAAVEDTMSALAWTAANRNRLADAATPLMVAGDSAGGNLAAVASILARDSGGPTIAAQILIYPATSGDIDAPALKAFESPFLTHSEIAWFFDQYVPDRGQRRDPRFAPTEVTNLAGLPPAFILTAENDLLRHEGEEFGLKLVQAGVPVTMRRYMGTAHGFFNFLVLRQWQEAHADIAAFIAATLQTGSVRAS